MLFRSCRFCGCTDLRACSYVVGFTVDEEEGADELVNCSWLDAGHTLCSNPQCVAKMPLDELLELCFPQPKRVAVAG